MNITDDLTNPSGKGNSMWSVPREFRPLRYFVLVMMFIVILLTGLGMVAIYYPQSFIGELMAPQQHWLRPSHVVASLSLVVSSLLLMLLDQKSQNKARHETVSRSDASDLGKGRS